LARPHAAAGTAGPLVRGGMLVLVPRAAGARGPPGWAGADPEGGAGVPTGGLAEPLCIDEGKVHWASTVARELGVHLDECTCYTDDAGDLALLELVGEPVAVNPDPRLRREAVRRGWPVIDFAAPGERGEGAPVPDAAEGRWGLTSECGSRCPYPCQHERCRGRRGSQCRARGTSRPWQRSRSDAPATTQAVGSRRHTEVASRISRRGHRQPSRPRHWLPDPAELRDRLCLGGGMGRWDVGGAGIRA